MNTDKIRISGVQAGSIAEELGIETGDYLVSINGNAICDVFDYRFHTADEFLTLEIEKQNGERWSAEIEKAEEEDLGLEFDNPLMDEEKSCSNKCVFCFIDQLPPGMRETLYYKDDDARLSFLFGNYITMTNLKEEEIDRIIRYRMSPINVSVHTTNPSLRVKMLNNRFAGDVL
ncbi:MAG TPA: PDZ domain-containing protein, partial [Thermoclostridium caenicola]|nr:PDZ domain-containing protein [Thermoclostridium caenicola]